MNMALIVNQENLNIITLNAAKDLVDASTVRGIQRKINHLKELMQGFDDAEYLVGYCCNQNIILTLETDRDDILDIDPDYGVSALDRALTTINLMNLYK